MIVQSSSTIREAAIFVGAVRVIVPLFQIRYGRAAARAAIVIVREIKNAAASRAFSRIAARTIPLTFAVVWLLSI
jgi:hypothetical protein